MVESTACRRSETRSPTTTLLLLDFDGTIACEDVGNLICERFARPEWSIIEARYRAHEISLDTAQRAMWSLVNATPEAVLELVATVDLRDGLDGLLQRADRLQVPVFIVSGGFEWYIRALLGERVRHVHRIYANRLHFRRNDDHASSDDHASCNVRSGNEDRSGTVVPEFVHQAEFGCERCAICKARVIAALRADAPTAASTRIVFVGDGASDQCAAPIADTLYAVAGSTLEAYCQAQGIPHHAFESFDAIDLEGNLSERSDAPEAKA